MSIHLGVGDELQDARRHLHPEVQEDAGGQQLLLLCRYCRYSRYFRYCRYSRYFRYCRYLGVAGGGDVLQVDGPQLGEDEGVEEGAHVHHGGLALLREPRQDNLSSEVR